MRQPSAIPSASFLLAALLGLGAIAGCSGSSAGVQPNCGAENQACCAANVCGAGLRCQAGTCVGAASGDAGAAQTFTILGGQSSGKVDLLLMVDNSSSMADKYGNLALSLPSLIKALTNPDLDATGKPKTQAATDLHVGIITSSLGSHGTSACDPATYGAHQDDHGHLMPRAADPPIAVGYTVTSVGGTPTQVACPGGIAAASAVSWAFTAGTPAPEFSGTGQVPQAEAAVSCVVQAAHEDGCGY